MAYTDREAWLTSAAHMIAVEKLDGILLPRYRVACSWPPGRRPQERAWHIVPADVSNDDTTELYIMPDQDEPTAILTALFEALNRLASVRFAPLSAAYKAELAELLGPYPHGACKPHKPQKGRMLKLYCNYSGCGFIARTTAKWAAMLPQRGAVCPVCLQDSLHIED